MDTSSSCNNYYFDTDEISHTITTLARDVHDIYNLEDNYSYNADEYFTDETNAALTDLRTQTKAILVAYAGLTPEEAEALPDLSSRKQKDTWKGGLKNDETIFTWKTDLWYYHYYPDPLLSSDDCHRNLRDQRFRFCSFLLS